MDKVMITFSPYPVPVDTLLGEGYLLYVQSGEMLENDIWTVILLDGGVVKHFTTEQLTVMKNGTFDIVKNK